MKNKKKRAQSSPPAQPSVGSSKWAIGLRIVTAVGALILFFVAILELGSWLHPTFDPFGWKEGHLEPLPPVDSSGLLAPNPSITLVAHTREEDEFHRPLGPNLPTPVTFENDGGGDVVIRKATFTYSKRFRTPHRDTEMGMVICIPLNFYKPVKPGARTYSLTLRPPKSASEDDYVAVEIAVIDKRLVGWSYVGTLKLHYNENKVVTVPNVVVDVLAKMPEPSESRE